MTTKEFFQNKPIFAMLHLAGRNPVTHALDELSIFEEESVDGVIVENYHGTVEDVTQTLEGIQKRGTKLQVGVNILPNNYQRAFHLAEAFVCSFIQLDFVAGRYERAPQGLEKELYGICREKRENFVVLGGVWPKYYAPLEGSVLEDDLREGMQRADAIVITGDGTGMETPLEKIQTFRRVLGGYPLIIGAGLTPENARPQLMYADGAIVGSCLKKDNDTEGDVDRLQVRAFMDAVRRVREEKKEF